MAPADAKKLTCCSSLRATSSCGQLTSEHVNSSTTLAVFGCQQQLGGTTMLSSCTPTSLGQQGRQQPHKNATCLHTSERQLPALEASTSASACSRRCVLSGSRARWPALTCTSEVSMLCAVHPDHSSYLPGFVHHHAVDQALQASSASALR